MEEMRTIKEEEWENIRHMYWVLMRSLERFAEDNREQSMMFERMDTEAAYRLWNKNFNEGRGEYMYPSWMEGKK